MVRIYDTPNNLYDKGVSYFLLILWLEYITPPNYLYPLTIYTIGGVIFSTHSVVRIYDTPNYLYDKGVSYFLLILWLEYMTPPNYLYDKVVSHFLLILWLDYMTHPNYLYDKGVSYFLLILWLEYMTPPTIYTIMGCHIFYSFCG